MSSCNTFLGKNWTQIFLCQLMMSNQKDIPLWVGRSVFFETWSLSCIFPVQWPISSTTLQFFFVWAADCFLKENLLRDKFNPLDCSGTPAFLLGLLHHFSISTISYCSYHSSFDQSNLEISHCPGPLLMNEGDPFTWQNVWCSSTFGPLLVAEGGALDPLLIDEGGSLVFKPSA